MLSNLMTVGGQVLALFLMMMTGYCLGKAKLLPKEALPGMTNVAIYLGITCMVIKGFELEYTDQTLHQFLWALLLSVLVHIINFILSDILIRSHDQDSKRVLICCAVFSNVGFIGYPLLQGVMGHIGLLYGSAYNLIFMLIMWTLGLRFLSGSFGSWRKIILNPGVISIILGLSIFFFRIELPPILESAVTHFGNLSVPLPMLIIGCQLANADLKALLHDRWNWISAALRLLILPILELFLFQLCGFRGDLLLGIVICAAAPPAALVAMLSESCGRDPVLASGAVSFQTLLSVLTMPVVVSIAQLFA